jgi:vacuolar-type H+-ATPase subunit I/STV1
MFNEAKMTYKNSVEKSELLLDSFYLRYKDDDSFQSVKDDDDDQSVKIDQSMRVDQSVRKRENSDSENSNHQEENLIEIISHADSLTEVQSVKGNLTSSSADSSQSVKVDQTALHAAENTLVASADQDHDDDHFVLASDSKSNEMINSINHQTDDQIDDQTDNRLISEKNNPLILNYPRSKIRHHYKQLHHRDFVKAAKQIGSIKSTAEHDLVTSKTFKQIINDPQAKE